MTGCASLAQAHRTSETVIDRDLTKKQTNKQTQQAKIAVKTKRNKKQREEHANCTAIRQTNKTIQTRELGDTSF